MGLPSIINPAEQNRPAAQVKLEQEEEIYNKLYVKATEDFIHKDDFNAWKEKFEKKLDIQNRAISSLASALQAALTAMDTLIATHVHAVPGVTPGPGSTAASPSMIKTSPVIQYTGQPAAEKLTDQIAKSYIDNSSISGFDSSIEQRKKSKTQLKPPLSSENI